MQIIDSNSQKTYQYKKWWGRILIAFCMIAIIAGVVGARNASSSDLQQQEQHQGDEESRVPNSEKDEYDPQSLNRIYDQVRVGMTEGEVQEVIGEPTWTDETDVENLGHVKSLLYNEPVSTSFNNVSVVLHKGEVELVVLQEMHEGHLVAVRAKM